MIGHNDASSLVMDKGLSTAPITQHTNLNDLGDSHKTNNFTLAITPKKWCVPCIDKAHFLERISISQGQCLCFNEK